MFPLAAPPAVLKEPPSRTLPSGAQAAVSTWPLTFGSQAVTRYGATEEKANALLRPIAAVVPPFFTALNRPTAYIVVPHWTIWRTCSMVPSVPEVASEGTAAGVELTAAPALPGARATVQPSSTAAPVVPIRRMRMPDSVVVAPFPRSPPCCAANGQVATADCPVPPLSSRAPPERWAAAGGSVGVGRAGRWSRRAW